MKKERIEEHKTYVIKLNNGCENGLATFDNLEDAKKHRDLYNEDRDFVAKYGKAFIEIKTTQRIVEVEEENPYFTLAYIMVQELYERFEDKRSLLVYLNTTYNINEEELKAVEDIWDSLYNFDED